MKRAGIVTVLVVIGPALLVSCNKFEYDGGEFPSTDVDSVVVYLEDDEIDRPYTVIGHLSGTKHNFTSMEGLRRAMVREAAKRGADGIAFMAETESEEDSRKKLHAVNVASPMERPYFTSTKKGCWALLIRFK